MTRRRRSQGQGLVEFALVIPVFMLVVLGLIDTARFVYLNSTVSQAAREGARVGSVESSYRGSAITSCGTAGGPVCPSNDAALLAHIRAGANRMMVPFGSVDNVYMSCVASTASPPGGSWTSSTCSSNSSGSYLSVRVTTVFHPLTPFLSDFIGVSLTGSATMTVN